MKNTMSEIHGLAVHAAGAQLLPYKYDPGELKANEVEVRISHCGVCRSDVHLIDNDWGISKLPVYSWARDCGDSLGGGLRRARPQGWRAGRDRLAGR